MRASLFVKLLAAFALVIVVLVGAVILLLSRTTASQFELYVDRSGELWAQRLAPALADYYQQTGSWQGVDSLLGGSGPMPGMTGNGGTGRGRAGAADGLSMWSMMGERLLLADAAGRVVVDSDGQMAGQDLGAHELASGIPIVANGARFGTIIVAPDAAADAPSPAGDFLAALNRSLLLAGLAAGLLALGLGAFFFFQLTAPLRDLHEAAGAIAAGDLDRRVEVRSNDEIGDLAEAFNQMAASLSEADEQRRKMVPGVVHELRTPLAALQANLEAMQDRVLSTDAGEIDNLHEEALQLSRLVADLRLLSLADAGQLPLDLAETDLAALVRHAADRLRPAAQERGIRLQVAVDGAPAGADVDAGRLNQVITNLLDNAFRYTPGGGTVRVTAACSGTPQPASFVVSVVDTGPGISPHDLPHVFDRFYRADKSRTRTSGGTGLGLAIVKSLVTAHGGTVWANSPVYTAPDGRAYGTRVTFTIPLSPEGQTN